MDDVARQAQVARGLIHHCFRSERGCSLAITEDSVAGPVTLAADGAGPPPVERAHRTVDSYLRYAEHDQAAHRAIVGGGVGFDTEVHAIRNGVRETIVATVAEGAHGRTDIAPVARMGPPARVCSVEGAVLAWIDHGELSRETMGELLVKTLDGAVRAVEELDPACPALAPVPVRRDAHVPPRASPPRAAASGAGPHGRAPPVTLRRDSRAVSVRELLWVSDR